MNRTLRAFPFFLLALVFFWGCPWGEISAREGGSVHRLVVLHTNDTHGHPLRFFHHPAPDAGGLPARATLVKEIRSQNRNVLVLDAGDLNTGRAESNLFNAEPDIVGYNYIGYDAMVLGNHEFDHPLQVLRAQMGQAAFPFLAANVKTGKGEYLARPYIIRTFEGFKVAVLGLTTKDTPRMVHPDYVRGLVFEDEVGTAKKLVPILRRQADLVIALTHMGLYPSTNKGSRRLATQVEGIDLIVDGHTHTRMDSPVVIDRGVSGRKTWIVQAWQWGLVMGRVDISLQDGKVVALSFRSIPINLKTVERRSDGPPVYRLIGREIKEDPELLAKLQPFAERVAATLSEVIGYAERRFSSRHVRRQETAIGNLVADSMRWFTRRHQVDFAIQNAGGIRGDLPAGALTKKHIHDILPFDNSVVVLTLRGSDVASLLAHMARVSKGRGAFPQLSKGVAITLDRAAGRYTRALIDGRPIDPSRTYRIATNSYLAHGGDGYFMFLNACERYDTSVLQRDALIQYIKSLGGRLRPEVRGRIKVLQKGGADTGVKDAA
jgi:5'-nucleotidase/UDP-sugar diphosphatase